jgi:hypothetical protein
MSSPSDNNLQAHPLLSRLLEHNTVPYRGYIGPRSKKGRVTLYQSLGDLSFYLEIDESDIVASAPAPEQLLPHGGTVVWVKQDAEVVSHGKRVNVFHAREPQIPAVRRLLTADADPGAGDPPMVQVETGRLNIRLRQRARSTCASCHCSSCQTHPTCTCEPQDQQPVIVVAE